MRALTFQVVYYKQGKNSAMGKAERAHPMYPLQTGENPLFPTYLLQADFSPRKMLAKADFIRLTTLGHLPKLLSEEDS